MSANWLVVELHAGTIQARATSLPCHAWRRCLIEDQVAAHTRDRRNRDTWQLGNDPQHVVDTILAIAHANNWLGTVLCQAGEVGQGNPDRLVVRPDTLDIERGKPGCVGIDKLAEPGVAMADLRQGIGTGVAFALGEGAGSGAGVASVVEEDHTTASDAMWCGGRSGLCEDGPQFVQVDVAMTQGIVERGPMALHGEGEFGGRVWTGGLGNGVDEFEQRSGALGEGLIYFVAELRQAFECVHTQKSARSSVLSQGPLL